MQLRHPTAAAMFVASTTCRMVASTLLVCSFNFGCTGFIDGDAAALGGAGSAVGTAGGNAGGSSSGTGAGPGLEAATVAREPLHRLNRLEYDRTVRDLLGTNLAPAANFPPDPASEGLDNLASALTLGAPLLDLYAGAAKALTAAALDSTPRFRQRLVAAEHHRSGTSFSDWGWLVADGEIAGMLAVPQAERVTLTVLAGGTASNSPDPEMTLWLDGKALKSWTVASPASAPTVFSVVAELSAGMHALKVTFDNRANNAPANQINQLIVGYIEAKSDAIVKPTSWSGVYTCDPASAADADGCYRSILTTFAGRAWRRPLTQVESDGLTGLWQRLASSEGKEEALKLSIRGLLVSPQFLYRASVPGSYASPALAGVTDTVPLDDYALASRLSYFLWSSMPDQALFDEASRGALRDDEGLRAATRRMLLDAKAGSLVDGFAEQWLQVRALAHVLPDPATYPAFDAALKEAMADEAKTFFQDFLRNGRPLEEMLTPSFGFLNDRLATHYGLPSPGSAAVVRVDLPAGARAGLITQGAWLTASSESTRTSPVRRGRFVLEELLCTPIPPPPDAVAPFEENGPGLTIRETLAAHRQNITCAGCHNLLDPIGLGLEELDGIGSLRTEERGQPIDSSGALPPDGPAFVGAAQFAQLLKQDPRFVDCLSRKLMTYGLGRKLDDGDGAFVTAITGALREQGSSLAKLIELIVLSPAFRGRSADLKE